MVINDIEFKKKPLRKCLIPSSLSISSVMKRGELR